MKRIGALLVAAGLSVAPVVALAADPVEAVEAELIRVYDTGTHAAVVVRGAVADVDNIKWRWGKMHVPIDKGPGKVVAQSFDDPTVKRVAVIGGESPRVLLMLRHGDKLAKKITAAVELEAIEGGFRILVPRKQTVFPPPEPVPAPEPEPQPAPPATAEVPAVAAVESPIVPHAAPEPALDESERTPVRDMSSVVAAIEAGDDKADSMAGIATASTQSSQAAWMGIMTSLVLLCVCGGALWWIRRKKPGVAPGTRFEVLGNQVLGGKSRLVLLGLGDRRMLLAVGEGGTTLVDKWNSSGAVEAAATAPDPAPERAVEARPRISPPPPPSLSSVEFDAPRGNLALRGDPAWLDELRGAAESAATPAVDPPDAESSAVTGLLELRRRGLAQSESHGGGTVEQEDRWVAALAAQLRVGDS